MVLKLIDLNDLSEILKDFNSFIATPFLNNYDLTDKVNHDLLLSQATFVRKEINVVSENTSFVYLNNGPVSMLDLKGGRGKNYLDIPRNMQHLVIEVNKKKLLVGNLHGFWMPISKGDSPQRINQSKKIKEIFDTFNDPKILCGDFNLRPDTKSVAMLEENLRNLIIEYGITSTRSVHHKRTNKYADYVMVSDDIKIEKFEAMDEHVSDHLPLFLEFSV